MKKLLISAALVVSALAASAQDYKPLKGNVTAEFGVTGGISFTDLNLNNNAGQLRFRYFLADQLAARVGVNISSFSEKNVYFGGTNGDQEGTETIKSSTVTFNLGVEKHFSGSDRLSTYAGADLLIIKAGASESWENYDGGGYFDGFNATLKGYNNNGDAGGFGYGLRVVGGADYYFVEKVYIGAEFGWGFTSFKNAKTSTEVTPGTGAPTTTTEVASDGGNFELSPSVVTGVRLGFRF